MSGPGIYRTGERKSPMTYDRFFFNCNDGISRARLKQIKAKYGTNVLIGVDPGPEIDPSDVAQEMIDNIKELGFGLHIYLVGPGMMTWSAGERAQIKMQAESVQIDTNKKKWHDEWIDWGWRDFVEYRFQYYYKTHNAHSCEIDNLDSALGDDPDAYVEYYKELFGNLKQKNIPVKLMLKNLSEEKILALINYDSWTPGITLNNSLCEWGMFEEGSGDSEEQINLCKKLGIMAITPENGLTDTYHYGVVAAGVPSL